MSARCCVNCDPSTFLLRASRAHVWMCGTFARVFCVQNKLRFWRDDERPCCTNPPLLPSMKRKSYNTGESYRPTPGRKRPWLLKRGWCASAPFPALDLYRNYAAILYYRTATGRILKDDKAGWFIPELFPARIIRVLVLFQWASPPVDSTGCAWAMKNVRPCEKYDDKRGMKRTEKGQRRRSRLRWLIVAPGFSR